MAGSIRYYRRTPGAGWLVALIAVPLVLGLIGWTGTDRSAEQPAPLVGSATATLTPGGLAGPAVMLAPFSLRRKGNDVTLAGQIPDRPSQAFALDRTRTLLPGTRVLDLLTPIEGVTAVDLTGLDEVLTAAESLTDFGFSVEGGNIVLFGTVQSDAAKTEVEEAVGTAWPDLKVINDIAVLPAAPAPPG